MSFLLVLVSYDRTVANAQKVHDHPDHPDGAQWAALEGFGVLAPQCAGFAGDVVNVHLCVD